MPMKGGGGGSSGSGGAGASERPRPAQQKLFTVATATATLPLVKVIVKDAMEKWKELGHMRAELSDAEVHAVPELKKRQLRSEVERIEADLEACVREIADLGASIKDFELGLVDFPMKQGARTVLLCWKAGETKIGYFHDMDAGFAGRRPLSELERSERSGGASPSPSAPV
jgi:hypothetical protein